MTMITIRPFVFLLLASTLAQAGTPALNAPLPTITIAERGELILEDDDFSYRSWYSGTNPGKPHIIQYFSGTMSASKTFKPFTDRLQAEFELGRYHVSTVINLDAATWGTTGFVVSEVKSSKQKFPLSTMVLDKEGVGASVWQLGKKGALLVVMDSNGTVKYLAREPMEDTEIDLATNLVKSLLNSGNLPTRQ
jgi:YtfJ family uncharacterized protein